MLLRTFLLLTCFLSLSLGGTFQSWRYLGPQAGIPNDLAFSPADASLILAVGGNGVFRSVDGGASWTRSVTGLDPVLVHRVAFDPTQPGRVFVGTEGGGVFRSLDAGLTWSPINEGLSNLEITAIVLNPQDGTLFVGTDDGIFTSHDGGDVWTAISTGLGPTRSITNLVLAPSDSEVLYATVPTGVFRSGNGGSSWVLSAQGLPLLVNGAIAVHPSDPNLVFVGIDQRLLYVTRDGMNWTPLPFLATHNTLAFDPNRPDELMIGSISGRLFVEVDDFTRTEVGTRIGTPFNGIFRMCFSESVPNVMLASTETGTYRSQDGGEAWTSINDGLRTTSVRNVEIDPVNPLKMYLGHDAGQLITVDGGRSWFNLRQESRVARDISVDPNDPLSLASAVGDRIMTSTDGGLVWNREFLLGPDFRSIEPQVVRSIHREKGATGQMLAVSGSPNSLHTSVSFFGWGFVAAFPPGSTPRTTVTDGDTFFVGTANGLRISLDRGVTWQIVGDLEGDDVFSILFEPGSTSTLFAATDRGVFKSADHGLSWSQPADSALSGLLVKALAIDREDPSRLWAAAWGVGVFMSDDGSGSWTELPSQPESLHIWRLRWDGALKRRLIASTLGGIFSLDLEDATPASFLEARIDVDGRASFRSDLLYAVRLTNTGSPGQTAAPMGRFAMALPPTLMAVEAIVDQGTARFGPGNQSVIWSGALAPGQPVNLSLRTRVVGGRVDEGIPLQGVLQLDADGDQSLESFVVGRTSEQPLSTPVAVVEGSSLDLDILAVPHTLPIPDTFVGVALVNRRFSDTVPLLFSFNSDGTPNQEIVRDTLPRFWQTAFTAAEALPDPAQTLGVRGETRGFFLLGDNERRRLDGIGDLLIDSQLLIFPEVRATDSQTAHLYLFNPDLERSSQVSLRLLSAGGQEVGQVDLTLAPFGSTVASLGQLFGDLELPDGYVRAEADAPIRGFVLIESDEAFTTLPGMLPTFSDRLTAPHAFWNDMGGNTRLRLLNTSGAPIAGNLFFFGDLRTSPDELRVELAPGAVREVDLRAVFGDGPTDSAQGWIDLRIEAQMLGIGPFLERPPLVATVTYDGGVLKTLSSLPMLEQATDDTLFLQVAHSDELAFFQGLALVNPHPDKSILVVLQAFSSFGRTIGFNIVRLPPGGRSVGLLDAPQFFGQGFAQVGGHLQVSSSDGSFSVYSLFGGAGTLAAVQGVANE